MWIAVPKVFWVTSYGLHVCAWWVILLAVFDFGAEAGCRWGRFYITLLHEAIHPFQGIGYPGINPFQVLEVSVDTLCPLLAHPPCTDVPSSHPWDSVLLQLVHFGQHCCPRKHLPVEGHELLDVRLCKYECGGTCCSRPLTANVVLCVRVCT